MAQPSRIPKLLVGMGDSRSLPLAPIDGFVMSRVNGALSVRDIAAHTGLTEDVVLDSLDKLLGLGVIAFDGEPRVAAPAPASAPALPPIPPAPPPPLITPAPGSTPAVTAKSAARSSAPPPQAGPRIRQDLPPIYDPRELDEDCDLEPEARRRVLDLFYELDDLNFYQLLGVQRTADKKAIKRAYFELAALFHPDKFFRKNLGTFKQKMEIIFGRVTEAHDALTSREQRPEYDAYLEAQEQARGIEATIATGRDELARAQERLRNEAPTIPPPPAPEVGTPVPAPAGPMPELRAPLDPREAREALARRLMGSAARASTVPRKGSVPPTAQEAMGALKRRMEDRRTEASRGQITKYRADGDAARAKGDMPAAASNYRVAAGLAPNDEELRQLAEDTQAEADRMLAETYLKQAAYEERSGHWPEAARSWGRVVKGRKDDASAHERYANALVEASGNLHAAADAAKRSIELAPNEVRNRITLAKVYVAAELPAAARRECEAALKIKPDHPELLAALRRLQKAQ